jgi:hypothetical protein
MLEKRHEPLLPTNAFILRLVRFGGLAFGLTLIWWSVGILGYHLLAGMDWVDAILNSAMIVGGMGPMDALHTVAAKLFASLYAICSGVVFIGVAGILFVPIAHRVLHHFHLEAESDAASDETQSVLVTDKDSNAIG